MSWLGRVGASLGAVALACIAVSSGGCEAIVPNDVPAYTCAGLQLSACPAGMYCQGSGCTACETKDVCDGYDNDCNGTVDDGPYSDHDDDGYTFCGHIDANSGRLVAVDCDDDDPNVHPSANEVCNGKDDDCDGVIDNADQVCPANETCVPKQKKCIGNAQACTPANCPAPMICDPDTQACVQPGGGLGTPCQGDNACTSGVCGDAATLGTSGNVCTQVCCSSNDCGAGFVCFGSGSGGNYCVKPDAIGRPATVGAGAAGAPCGGAADCRSGVCTANLCVDTCCSDATCTNGTSCAVTQIGGRGTFGCITPPGSRNVGDTCHGNGDCKTGFCAGYTDGITNYQVCAPTCCSSFQCGTVDTFSGPQQIVCYDDPTPNNDGTVALCDQPKQGTGNGRVGDACTKNGDCFSDHCGSDRHCTDVCCVDGDCGNAAYVCRPTQVGSGTYLRCVPKPANPT